MSYYNFKMFVILTIQSDTFNSCICFFFISTFFNNNLSFIINYIKISIIFVQQKVFNAVESFISEVEKFNFPKKNKNKL